MTNKLKTISIMSQHDCQDAGILLIPISTIEAPDADIYIETLLLNHSIY
jgi:hypothetical protein